MPAYVYACRSCRQTFTVRHSMSERPPVICTGCGSRDVERDIWSEPTNVGTKLKGTTLGRPPRP